MMIRTPQDGNYRKDFEETHKREFGFILSEREIHVDNLRVRTIGRSQTINPVKIETAGKGETPKSVDKT